MASSKTALLLVSLCLLLTSCFRIENAMKVEDDGRVSVDQTFGVNLDKFSPRAVGLEGDSLPAGAQDQFCDAMRQGTEDSLLPQQLGQEVRNYKDGDYCGVVIKTELPAGTDHSTALSTILEQQIRLTQLSDGWEFDAAIALERLALNRGFTAADITEARDGSEVTFEVELPGSAIEGKHNATSVSGGTFTWEIDLLNPPERIFATTGPTTGLDALPVSPVTIGVIGFIFAVLGGLVWFFLRSETEPVAAAAVQSTATTAVTVATASVGATQSAAATTPPGTPYRDESMGVWVMEHPTRGKLWHHEKNDEWVPF